LKKINAQHGTSNSCLQKTGSEYFALELNSFGDETPSGDWFFICSLERGPDGLLLEEQGIMLNVAPVSTKNLSFVNSSMRKIKPASAGKCMSVAVTCAGIVAKPVNALWLFSFPTSCKVLHTCRSLHCIFL
jgi:hypothetical protein